MKVVILHDNADWIQPYKDILSEENIELVEWRSNEVDLDLTSSPPDNCIFYNRCSASAAARNNPTSVDRAKIITTWLENHGCQVINGKRSPDLEGSKAYQYVLCQSFDIPVPRTFLTSQLTAEFIQERFGASSKFVVKPDRGASGIGVRLFDNLSHFEKEAHDFSSNSEILLVQDFIPNISGLYRAEFVGKKYLYTTCAKIDNASNFENNMCPCVQPLDMFQVLPKFDNPILMSIEKLLEDAGVDNAGVEFLFSEDGIPHVVDINTNTRYHQEAEKAATVQSGYKAVVELIKKKIH